MEIKTITFKVTPEEHEILRLWCIKEKKFLRALFVENMINKGKETILQTK